MSKKNSQTNRLYEAVSICIEKVSGEVEISPEMVAMCALKELDPDQSAPILVTWGCNLELRQIARQVLRKTFDPLEREDHIDQGSLFEGLQAKYPCKRDGEDVYVDRMVLTKNERDFNIRRLRSEGLSKLEHADALQIETEELDGKGFFATKSQLAS